MNRRLSSSTRSHTEDSIFLRPDEDPVWLDEPTKMEKMGDGGPKKDALPEFRDGTSGGKSLHREEQFMHKLWVLLTQIHCWAAAFLASQVTGYWVFFVLEGNGPLSSIYKALHIIDFYLGFILPCHPIFGVDSKVLTNEVINTTQHTWIVQGTVGSGIAICVVMVIHMAYKWHYGTGLWLSGSASGDISDRRQSVSRQPSFTLSEWTDAQEDLLDLDTIPQTPVFEMGTDTRTECDAATLTVTPVGLQERRGSNVSLTLDMCTPGCTEPYGYGAQLSPRDQSAQEYLRQGTHILTPALLHTRAMDDQSLQAEFYETPMNFVDPKEYNYPGLVRKNRYKTILPNTHSRVILKSQDEDDFLSTYINANYLKGYDGEEHAYIATQGPTVNTVGDFWRMVWQERSPIIVMITNLEEKNEVSADSVAGVRSIYKTSDDGHNDHLCPFCPEEMCRVLARRHCDPRGHGDHPRQSNTGRRLQPEGVYTQVRGGGAQLVPVLVHLMARPKDSRQSSAPAGTGTRSGESPSSGPTIQWPHNCPLQVKDLVLVQSQPAVYLFFIF
uniref:protein-tyrosine-phosphatase n=1 Tax=Cynoglossus semilaevis TaxID=244447 RepID=A0A3P8VHX9_CYNSE